jgi:tetratricopeptide (TPR) repeat protein
MPIKGSLKEASLAEVCQLLALGQKTGSLSVADRSRFGQIFFDRGRICFARVVNRRDRLGDLLVADGVLSQEQVDAMLELQQKHPERRLGELLLEHHALRPEDLQRFIRMQIEEAVYHLFTWTRGQFYFEVGERPEPGEALVSVNAESLLLEAARRIDEWSLVEKRIPSLDLVFELDRERVAAAGAELTAEQRAVAGLLDGYRSVQDIIDRCDLGEFEVGKALFGLIQAGFARRVERRADAGDRPRESEASERLNLGIAFFRTGMLDDAAREFRRVLEISDDDPRARFHLALISMRQEEYRDAARELVLLARKNGARFAVFLNLATSFRHMGRMEDALLALDEAEALRPGTPAVALGRAVTLVEARRLAESKPHFEDYRSRLRNGERPEPAWYYYLALGAALGGDADRAQAVCWEGLEIWSDSAPLLQLAGLAAERMGDLDGAALFYRRAIEVEPGMAQAHKGMGDVSYVRGATEEAMRLFQRATELAPDLGDDVYAKLGALHYRSRNREAAVRCWVRALELNPANDWVRTQLEVLRNAAG